MHPGGAAADVLDDASDSHVRPGFSARPGCGRDPATGSASGPLGAYAVKYGLIERAPKVEIVSEQGTKMGRQSFVHIELAYGESKDIPERIEVGGSVMPVVSGTLAEFS